MPGTSSPSANSVNTYPGIARGSTSAHSIQRRPGNSKKDTSAASEVPSRKVPAPTPTRMKAVACIASGRRPEKRRERAGGDDEGERQADERPCHEHCAEDRADGEAIERPPLQAAGLPGAQRLSPTPNHLVHEVERLREVRAGAVHVDRVLLEVAELSDLLRRPRTRHHRELMVVLGEHLLLSRLEQELDQLAGVLLVVAATHDAEAGEVHVRAAPLLVGPLERHGEVGVGLELAAQVVGVGQAHVAVAVGDRVQHVGVRAEDVRVVRHPAAQHAPRWPRARPSRDGRRRTRRCTRWSRSAGTGGPSTSGRRGPRRWSPRRASRAPSSA